MKNIVVNEKSRSAILNRINALKPGSAPKWGSMTVNEMMFHCAKIHNEIIKGKQTNINPTLRQHFLKILVLQLMKEIPKGIKTNPKYLKAKEDEILFETEQNHLIESVNQIANHNEEIYGNHPLLGPLHTKQWRRFMYMHLDHHLRQFGV